jgi:hypothetical protein
LKTYLDFNKSREKLRALIWNNWSITSDSMATCLSGSISVDFVPEDKGMRYASSRPIVTKIDFRMLTSVFKHKLVTGDEGCGN